MQSETEKTKFAFTKWQQIGSFPIPEWPPMECPGVPRLQSVHPSDVDRIAFRLPAWWGGGGRRNSSKFLDGRPSRSPHTRIVADPHTSHSYAHTTLTHTQLEYLMHLSPLSRSRVAVSPKEMRFLLFLLANSMATLSTGLNSLS